MTKRARERTRASFMSESQQIKLGSHARTHAYCYEQTGGKSGGVCRPGKTAKDRAMKLESGGGE